MTPTPPDAPTQDKPPESDHDILVEIRLLLHAILKTQLGIEQEAGMARKLSRKLAGLP